MTKVNCLGKAWLLPDWGGGVHTLAQILLFFLIFQVTLLLGDNLGLVMENMHIGIWSWKARSGSSNFSGESEVVQI